MKKLLSILAAFVLLSPALSAQALGFSAHAVSYFPKYQDILVSGSSNRTVGHTGKFVPGISLEANYILPGFNFPVTGYNGIDFTYCFPVTDSAVLLLDRVNGSTLQKLGTNKIQFKHVGLRFGYEIPQTFNDFLLLHVGWGMGMMSAKTTPIIPERSTEFPFDPSDFTAESTESMKRRAATIEILFGGVYELEKISITGQYSFLYSFGVVGSSVYRHSFNVGVFVPLKRF
jgi:hypothetical protein